MSDELDSKFSWSSGNTEVSISRRELGGDKRICGKDLIWTGLVQKYRNLEGLI